MTMRDQDLLTILQIVSNNDGAYGWYQIDRDLVQHGIAFVHVGQALSLLLGRGLITASGDPSQASSRYYITHEGIAFLEEQKRDGEPDSADPRSSSSS